MSTIDLDLSRYKLGWSDTQDDYVSSRSEA